MSTMLYTVQKSHSQMGKHTRTGFNPLGPGLSRSACNPSVKNNPTPFTFTPTLTNNVNWTNNNSTGKVFHSTPEHETSGTSKNASGNWNWNWKQVKIGNPPSETPPFIETPGISPIILARADSKISKPSKLANFDDVTPKLETAEAAYRRKRPVTFNSQSEPHPYGLHLNRNDANAITASRSVSKSKLDQLLNLKAMFNLEIKAVQNCRVWHIIGALLSLVLLWFWGGYLLSWVWTGLVYLIDAFCSVVAAALSFLLTLYPFDQTTAEPGSGSNNGNGMGMPTSAEYEAKLKEVRKRYDSVMSTLNSLHGDLINLENQIGVAELAISELEARLKRIHDLNRPLASSLNSMKAKMSAMAELRRRVAEMRNADRVAQDEKEVPVDHVINVAL